MRFEVQHALNGLDERTPAFIRAELFAHGSLEMRQVALETLTTLDPEEKSARVLRELIKLV